MTITSLEYTKVAVFSPYYSVADRRQTFTDRTVRGPFADRWIRIRYSGVCITLTRVWLEQINMLIITECVTCLFLRGIPLIWIVSISETLQVIKPDLFCRFFLARNRNGGKVGIVRLQKPNRSYSTGDEKSPDLFTCWKEIGKRWNTSNKWANFERLKSRYTVLAGEELELLTCHRPCDAFARDKRRSCSVGD